MYSYPQLPAKLGLTADAWVVRSIDAGRFWDVRQGRPLLQSCHRLAGILHAAPQGEALHATHLVVVYKPTQGEQALCGWLSHMP